MNTQLNDMNIQSKSFAPSTWVPKKELSAFEYSFRAENEPDYEKRKAIYLEALEKFPNTAWLRNRFTYFLHIVKKDYSNLEEYWLKALSIAPEHANKNGNYACFLLVRNRTNEATKYLEIAFLLNNNEKMIY